VHTKHCDRSQRHVASDPHPHGADAVSREHVELVVSDSWLFATNEQALEGVLKDRALSPATLGYVFDERVQKPLDEKIDEVNAKLEEATTAIDAKLAEANEAIIKASTIAAPIGIVYMQYAGMAAPADLWGGTWENISSTFAGRFFRAEGGNAAAFGSAQGDAIRNITGVIANYAQQNGQQWFSGAFYQNARNSYGGNGHTSGLWSIGFDVSRVVPTGVENRPINSTTRIWQRVA
jgi:hypothetical protein